METKSNSHYIIALLLGVMGVLILLVFVSLRSQADNTGSTATVANQAPTVDTVTIASTSGGTGISAFDLTENATTSLWVHGTYTDNNGCSEVESDGIETLIARSSVSSTCFADGSTTDDRYCYRQDSSVAGSVCSLTNCAGGTDVTGSYTCTFPVRNFADATDAGGDATYSAQNWVGAVIISDGIDDGDNKYSSTFEMNTLTAINVSSTVAYGSVALGATSSVQTITLTNTGNDNGTNANVYGTALTCTVGTIAVGQQTYTSSTSASPSTALTTASSSLGLNITKQTTSTVQATSNTRWMFTMPSSGLSGTCTGTVTFLATT